MKLRSDNEDVERQRDTGVAIDFAGTRPFMRTQSKAHLQHMWRERRPELSLNYHKKAKSVHNRTRRAPVAEGAAEAEAE